MPATACGLDVEADAGRWLPPLCNGGGWAVELAELALARADVVAAAAAASAARDDEEAEEDEGAPVDLNAADAGALAAEPSPSSRMAEAPPADEPPSVASTAPPMRTPLPPFFLLHVSRCAVRGKQVGMSMGCFFFCLAVFRG